MVNTFSWQYFNGSSWVTSPDANSHGYPEQFSGTGSRFWFRLEKL